MSMICFDMDGTIVDLYSVNDVYAKFDRHDVSPYVEAAPLVDMERLRELLLALSTKGWEIRVISWLAKGSNKEYDQQVRKAKKDWLMKYNFPVDKVHIIQYGTTKANAIRKATDAAILIDDDRKVRDGWHLGEAVNPMETDILEYLETLL